jgi:hypothetical protein
MLLDAFYLCEIYTVKMLSCFTYWQFDLPVTGTRTTWKHCRTTKFHTRLSDRTRTRNISFVDDQQTVLPTAKVHFRYQFWALKGTRRAKKSRQVHATLPSYKSKIVKNMSIRLFISCIRNPQILNKISVINCRNIFMSQASFKCLLTLNLNLRPIHFFPKIGGGGCHGPKGTPWIRISIPSCKIGLSHLRFFCASLAVMPLFFICVAYASVASYLSVTPLLYGIFSLLVIIYFHLFIY